MIIVFYDSNSKKIYICSPLDKTKIVSKDDPDLMSYIPNEDILYVTDGHYFTKQQFGEWLTNDPQDKEIYSEMLTSGPDRFGGFMTTGSVQRTDVNTQPRQVYSNRKYIHPKNNGTVLIEDIPMDNGEPLTLSGKWDFKAVDEIGEARLENSAHFRLLIKRGKVEVVDEQYVQQNKHKAQVKISPAEQGLNKILIKDGTPGVADKVADAGGMDHSGNVAVPIMVTGE